MALMSCVGRWESQSRDGFAVLFPSLAHASASITRQIRRNNRSLLVTTLRKLSGDRRCPRLNVKACREVMLSRAWVLSGAFCCSLTSAQEGTAALNGKITEQDGLPVTGVKVEAHNAGTNLLYSADTNEIGLPTSPQVLQSREPRLNFEKQRYARSLN